jgi:hypothetical protein
MIDADPTRALMELVYDVFPCKSTNISLSVTLCQEWPFAG